MCKWKKNYHSLTDIWFYQTIFHMDCLIWNCKLLCNNCNLIKAIVNSTLGPLDQKIVKTEILSQGPVQILSRDFFLTMKLKFLAFRVKLLHKSCTSKILKWFDSSENKNTVKLGNKERFDKNMYMYMMCLFWKVWQF